MTAIQGFLLVTTFDAVMQALAPKEPGQREAKRLRPRANVAPLNPAADALSPRFGCFLPSTIDCPAGDGIIKARTHCPFFFVLIVLFLSLQSRPVPRPEVAGSFYPAPPYPLTEIVGVPQQSFD
jgi:hypothetical protein